ncbi:hypothetical protein MNBD_GAMMA09-912 [hydrothermal vent metagenome]|uniref:Uncharacterized protein n=1 Tax=hydrothermal vent metagenome TaxID=652676 RepID=A0A3B0X9S6_9ZZZZ
MAYNQLKAADVNILKEKQAQKQYRQNLIY